MKHLRVGHLIEVTHLNEVTHLSDEEMIEHYYADAGSRAHRIAERHLEGCAECAAESRKLAEDMKGMNGTGYGVLSVEYGESVWSRVAVKLPAMAIDEAPRRRMPWGLAVGWAAACVVLIVGAFEVGRAWEHRQKPHNVAVVKPPAAMERQVVVVVLGEHLDRTERLLVELKHADGEDEELVKPLREEAAGLLAANHAFLEDADKSGDEALTQALDHLGHLLNDVANAPGGLNAASIARLQKEMQAEGLLFKVRVLRSRTPHHEMTTRVAARGGAA